MAVRFGAEIESVQWLMALFAMVSAARYRGAVSACHSVGRLLRAYYLPLLLLLLAGSGCAALIYEIVWFQLLQLVIGSSAVSLGLLLAAYMTGLCLGSAALPRVVSRRVHPLKVYAALELGIGVFGVLVLLAVPLVGRLYVAGVTQGVLGLVLRGTVVAVCLLPPTVLMGASLPALARWLEATPRGVSWVGWLYSANIAGAVAGCVLAGFYLLRVHDMAVATYAAAAINLRRCPGQCRTLASRAVRAFGTRARRRPWRRRGSERRSSTSPSLFPDCLRWARRWSGRGCCRCCWAERCIRSPSFSRCFSSACGPAAALDHLLPGASPLPRWR